MGVLYRLRPRLFRRLFLDLGRRFGLLLGRFCIEALEPAPQSVVK